MFSGWTRVNVVIVVLTCVSFHAIAQNTRISTRNSIGWYNYFGTVKVNDKFSVHTEYQWRRTGIIKEWQQSLLRVGLNYQVSPGIQLRVGYGWIETFPYGEIPLNNFGKQFTEHRVFEAVTLSHKETLLNFSHRFMLEQRWVGRYSSATLDKEDEFPLLQRMRYMFRMQVPLTGQTVQNRTAYIALYDEIFIGFGKNVNENIFDQNRIGVLAGYRFSDLFRIEAGYINQTVQLGREVNGRNVFQYNNGIIVNSYFNL
jgi:hypothetical protein